MRGNCVKNRTTLRVVGDHLRKPLNALKKSISNQTMVTIWFYGQVVFCKDVQGLFIYLYLSIYFSFSGAQKTVALSRKYSF